VYLTPRAERDARVAQEGAPDAAPADGHGAPLRELSVDSLSVRYPSSGRGVRDVDLVLDAGSVTVITGEVGSGKSTLVRALLGLIPRDRGEICWNGDRVVDPGAFLVPPRCAYVPQVPRLFSESLGHNVLLGAHATADSVDRALHLAVLDDDVAAMTDGLDTILGPRGVRLSGGQLQRAAAARALLRDTDLVVVDDPSSALDVETEELMWARLLERTGRTLLVVSNRSEVIDRADRVLVLANGAVATRTG
jgi:ATP-binding cassette subfamily B protein